MVDKDADRRGYIRVGRSLLISYKVLATKNKHIESVTKDISGGGMKIPFREKLIVGTLLDLRLDLLKAKKRLQLKGRVVWIKTNPKDTNYPFEAGVEFFDIKPGTQTMLSNYVQYLNRYELLRGHLN